MTGSHRMILSTCLIMAALLGGLSPAHSEEAEELLDLSLNQLVNVEVSSASRFKQKASEAPSAVEVLNAEDIRSFGWRTLADALNAIRGLTVRNDRNYSYLGVRGFSRTGDYTSRVLIMIDGRRMNDAVYDSGFLGEEFLLDTNLIDRIEYIPGSGSSVYGANALLGVVNVITKQGKDFNGVRLSGEAGSLDTYRGRATFGKEWANGADLLLNVSQFFSHGEERLYFPEFASINGGIAQDMDLERSSRLFGEFNYHDFTLRGGYVDRYKRVPTASFGAIFNDKQVYAVDKQGYLDLDYNTAITDGLGLELRAFHHWYDYRSVQAYDFNAPDPPLFRVLNNDAVNSRWWGGEIKLISKQFDRHKWLAGVDVQYDQQQTLINNDIDPYTLYLRSFNEGWRAGVYMQDEYRISDSLLLNVGVRLDHHHLIKTLQLHPRIGLIWDVTPALTTKLLYGSAFRAPNIYERDYNIPLWGFARNPNNREEKVKSYEAIAEWYPSADVKLLSTFYYNNLSQLLVQDTNSDGRFINDGHYQTYGFELQGEKRWDSGRLAKLSWTRTYTRADVLGVRSWAPDSPKNLVKLHYAEPLFDNRVRLGFEEIFVDERKTRMGNLVRPYHLVNVNLALTKPLYGFQASLGIYNVLGYRYQFVGGSEHVQDTLAADGRTVRFRLEYGF